MSKHSTITPGPDGDRPRAPRRPSLVERAADVYDFGSVLRGRGDPHPGPIVDPELVPQLATVDPMVSDDISTPVSVSEHPVPGGRFGVVAQAELRDGGFIVPGSAPTALSEEFRIVKRQILQVAGEVPDGRMLLVCSARPDEGKTWCAVNLALSLAAEKDLDVILIDADVAKPEVLSILGLASGPGLIDAIADETIDIETCLIRTDIPHLTVLPAGRHTNEATELLASARTKVVLDRLRARDTRRIVIFDSPPALAASPAGVLAMYCGQALFIVRAEKTSESDIREALELLSACPRPQLLLNGIEYGGKGRRFGRYYGVEG